LFVLLLVVCQAFEFLDARPVPLNTQAGSEVLYELQIRSANACNPSWGTSAQQQACAKKVAPTITYEAQGMTCNMINQLLQIKLGTAQDLMATTTDPQQGITLSYIKKKVGATAVWVMPPFPNNDEWNIPDACDNLGSPYAVRDFFHLRGSLSNRCILASPGGKVNDTCWANTELDEIIQQANQLGLKVFLDLSFNHFGHNYMYYDYIDSVSIRDRIAAGENLDNLWNFDATFDPSLVHPVVFDDLSKVKGVNQTAFQLLAQQCPNLEGHQIVTAYNMWQTAFDWERPKFNCSATFLEHQLFSHYLGSNSWDPAQFYGDFFTNNWKDVKFLFHHEDNAMHKYDFARVREYCFRVMNYWSSRGVAGFRLDHTTDPNGGMAANEWLYITTKVDYYAAKRGQARPIYLAEEFSEQMSMGQVVDIETEGYVGDMCGRSNSNKDATFVERVVSNAFRFNYQTYVMTALETHDEKRLTDGTGFDVWTGAGFWAIGASLWSTPMMLMGQELGEPWGLGFKRNDFLRSRFPGNPNYNTQNEQLTQFYNAVISARLNPANKAMLSKNFYFLRTVSTNSVDPRIFAQMKWDGTNVVFLFHNLWNVGTVAQSYYIPPNIASQALINDNTNYALVDMITGQRIAPCITGDKLKYTFYVSIPGYERIQWMRLELC